MRTAPSPPGSVNHCLQRHADAEDTSVKALVKKLIAGNVEQVYPYGNFASVGIGRKIRVFH